MRLADGLPRVAAVAALPSRVPPTVCLRQPSADQSRERKFARIFGVGGVQSDGRTLFYFSTEYNAAVHVVTTSRGKQVEERHL